MVKVQKLVVDAGPLLSQTRDELKASAEEIWTTPAVIAEIRDEAARQRLDLWKSEIKIQEPSAASVKFVQTFAAKTGDAAVLSRPDIGIIALCYELHDKEGLKSSPVVIDDSMKVIESSLADCNIEEEKETEEKSEDEWSYVPKAKDRRRRGRSAPEPEPVPEPEAVPENDNEEEDAGEDAGEDADSDADSDWGEDGWITTDNLTTHMNKDEVAPVEKPTSSALATRDYACQNVALQIGLDVLNDNGLRITQLRTTMQRCHACFFLAPFPKNMKPKQFCSQCGGHTLTRVTVSIQDGAVHLHLKANMQWKTRGDRYSLPKPQSRRARRERHATKVEFYAEDQPEYEKAVKLADRLHRKNERTLNQYVGPNVGDTGISPFAAQREITNKVRIGRGRHANVK